MVSGSRHLGRCKDEDRGRGRCGAALNHYFDMDAALRVHVHGQGPVRLLHGDAKGADAMAAHYWRVYQLGDVQAFPANWAELGKRAGNVRNEIMINHMPDLLVAFPYEGGSPGTWDAITRAREAGIPTSVYRVHHLCPLIERELNRA
jgi:hypothetical protein